MITSLRTSYSRFHVELIVMPPNEARSVASGEGERPRLRGDRRGPSAGLNGVEALRVSGVGDALGSRLTVGLGVDSRSPDIAARAQASTRQTRQSSGAGAASRASRVSTRLSGRFDSQRASELKENSRIRLGGWRRQLAAGPQQLPARDRASADR